MYEKVIYIRVIKNPSDWMKMSKVRELNGTESELVGFLGYNYSENETFSFFTSNNAWQQETQSHILKENVIHIENYKSDTVEPITNSNASLNECLQIFDIKKKKVSPHSWNITYKDETFENMSLEMIWSKLRELNLISF
jgi:hypothetical protein